MGPKNHCEIAQEESGVLRRILIMIFLYLHINVHVCFGMVVPVVLVALRFSNVFFIFESNVHVSSGMVLLVVRLALGFLRCAG